MRRLDELKRRSSVTVLRLSRSNRDVLPTEIADLTVLAVT
jgi:hypothetical protein